MKKTISTLLFFLLLSPSFINSQSTSLRSNEKLTVDSAGNYNDYIIEHWKKSHVKFKYVADMLNEPIKSKVAYLTELKAATKFFVETIASFGNLNEFNGDDMNFKFNTLNLLKYYKNCTEKDYPEIVELLTKSNPNYTQLQSKLDTLNAKGENLTKLFIKSQEDFAKLYKLELK